MAADRVDAREAAVLLHELAEAFRPILEKFEQAEKKREAQA